MACVAGVAVQLGRDGSSDDQLERYATRACAEGVDRACLLEARFQLVGDTTSGWYAARETLRRLCSADSPVFCMVAGDVLLSVGASSERARPFLDKACQNGHPQGCRLLGIAHRAEGKDASNAFEKGCFAGDVGSCKMLQDSESEDPDWAIIPEIGMGKRELLETAAGDCESAKQPDCVLWGELFRARMTSGGGESLASQLYELGCESGSAEACFYSGVAALHGFDGEPDRSRAKSLANRSCEMGWAPACDRKMRATPR